MKREIRQEMVDFLDEKLKGNGLAKEAIKNKDARLLFTLAAEACVGIEEEGGNNKGPMVSLIQDTVGGPDPWAWCASFVQTCLAYAELKTGKVSLIFPTERVYDMWVNTPENYRVVKIPARGAIPVWLYPPSKNGHTGVMTELRGKHMHTVEGNTSGGTNKPGVVEREGGGVYTKVRLVGSTARIRLLGFLKPFVD